MANVTIKPITRLLVANRGEIARRIFRTARDMGIATIAVYADGDANAPFVKEADFAVALEGRTALETYLNIDKVLNACRISGADAVHPGYGFLSENANFAEGVVNMGLIWVGPPASAIAQMGDKLSAKKLMIEAGVPTLPALEMTAKSDVQAAANEIGYPVLVKASAGGGGRGMRIVEDADGLEAAIEGAKREAGSAFGDDTVFLERWLTSSRHVELQILGDNYGNLVHIFERECSIQRRHQKIIEEAPSPAVSPDLRKAMGKAAVSAAEKIGYTSAGTVEFLVAGDEFWFLEVNTRLQVEHPITEEITGLDLVHEQLRLAEGDELGYKQKDLSMNGHSIEARLYAENPNRNFLPSPGTITIWNPSDLVRVDSGVESGSEVSVDFDPMIAKVISHGKTRREATAKLARALESFEIQGITNNRDFLVTTLRTPEFLAGDTTTEFIERVDPARVRTPSEFEIEDAVVAAAIHAQFQRRSDAKVLRHIQSGWRNSLMPPERTTYDCNDTELNVEYRSRRDGTFLFSINGEQRQVQVFEENGNEIDLQIDNRRIPFRVAIDGPVCYVHGPYGDLEFVERPRFTIPGQEELEGGLSAPMPGKVLSTVVSVGDDVEKGDLLVIMEAMKMEHRIFSPLSGQVTELFVQEGDQVDKDAVLVDIKEAEAA